MTTDQLSTPIDAPTLSDIVGFAWEMFNEARPIECAPARASEGFSATISIAGPWTATLEATLSEPLARRFAAAMLSDDPASFSTDDLADALGELANIVGGNVKGLLDDSLDPQLSLPTVTTSLDEVPGGELVMSCGFDWLGDVMTWSVYEVA